MVQAFLDGIATRSVRLSRYSRAISQALFDALSAEDRVRWFAWEQMRTRENGTGDPGSTQLVLDEKFASAQRKPFAAL